MACWRFYGRGTDPPYSTYDYEVFACGTTPEYRDAGNGKGFNLYIDGKLLIDSTFQFGSVRNFSEVTSTTYTPGFNSYGNCDGCLAPPDKYDCINGTCTISTKYNTPGLYQSLSDCQTVCANGGACAEGKQCVDPSNFCPPGKVCIDQGEYNDIENLISKIGSEVC